MILHIFQSQTKNIGPQAWDLCSADIFNETGLGNKFALWIKAICITNIKLASLAWSIDLQNIGNI